MEEDETELLAKIMIYDAADKELINTDKDED